MKRKSWKEIALRLAEDVVYQRDIPKTLIGQLPSTILLEKLARKVLKKGFKL